VRIDLNVTFPWYVRYPGERRGDSGIVQKPRKSALSTDNLPAPLQLFNQQVEITNHSHSESHIGFDRKRRYSIDSHRKISGSAWTAVSQN
jgi:hypothetical protein